MTAAPSPRRPTTSIRLPSYIEDDKETHRHRCEGDVVLEFTVQNGVSVHKSDVQGYSWRGSILSGSACTTCMTSRNIECADITVSPESIYGFYSSSPPHYKITMSILYELKNYIVNPVRWCMNVWLGSVKPGWDRVSVQVDCPNPAPNTWLVYGVRTAPSIVGLLKLGPVP